ncbi:MAG: flagellar filament capping protein FliD [Actinomycetota bacterium]|nr:flagellar filament capping protein FliD [Actinomycetota bacterium]
MSTISTSGGGSGPLLSLNGMISGMNTTAVIQALMLAVQQPQQQLLSQQSAINTQVTDYQQLNTDFSALQSAADAVSSPQAWQAVAATSSNTSAVTASTTGTGSPGSISFNVNQLAQSDALASANTVAATSDVITSGNFLASIGGNALGLTTLSGSSALALGNHTVAVTQALTGASTGGTSKLAASTTITSGTNDTIAATINGTAQTITIAAGTYTPTQLAQAVASASSGLLEAQVGANGQLQLSTSLLGSGSSLQVTGGTALSSLGLATQSSASVGTAGSITVDGTANAVNNVQAGSSVSLTSGTGGTVSATLGNFGTTVNSLTADNLSTGNGSLASVVSAINGSGLAMTASAVQSSAGAYRLQVSSNATGVSNDLSFNPAAFSSTIGNMNTITAGQDAQLQVGGSGGYTVDSASNTVTGLMPGLTVNLQQATTSPVTVSLGPDAAGLAKKVQALVTAANTALADIQTYAGYNATTKQGGPLMGDGTVNALTQQVLSVVGNAVGASNGSGGNLTAANAGLTLTSTGSLQFDSTTFQSAFTANPTGIAGLFQQGGSFAPASSTYAGAASFIYATDATKAGSYAVQVSHSATQATDLGTGVFASGATVTAGETVSVTVGGTTASYTTKSGDTLASVSQNLNQALGQAGISVSAQVHTGSSGQQLELTSASYGSASSFSVGTSGTGVGQFGLTAGGSTYTGTDVAGTINGVTATGQGQILTAPQTDPTLAGLSLQVTATGITTSTNLGTFTYNQGVAGGLGAVSYGASDPTVGNLTTTIQNLQQQSTNLGAQAAAYDPIITAQQQAYRNEFAQMEATLASLQNQNNWLAGQIKQLS